jgi:hypothetical protein
MDGVRAVRLAVAGTAVASSAALTVGAGSLLVGHRAALAPDVARALAARPLAFEPNQGQADARALYVMHGAGYTAFLTPAGAVFKLAATAGHAQPVAPLPAPLPLREAGVALRFLGARPNLHPTPLDRLEAPVTYMVGRRRVTVHGFARVAYRGVYPGIDVVYHGNERRLEYDWIVRPGADPKTIELGLAGVDHLRLRGDGALALDSGGIPLLQERPVVYQLLDGKRRRVSARFVVRARRRFGFAVGAYDRSRPLVIDPAITELATYGGANQDRFLSAAANPNGNLDFTGLTLSNDFPTMGGFTARGGGTDVIVVEVTKQLGLVFTDVIGGRDYEEGDGITVTPAGAIVIVGKTFSPDFPLVNPIDGTLGTGACAGGRCSDGFALWLSPNGSAITRSTFLGGSSDDALRFVTVNVRGELLMVGSTSSQDLPGSVYQGGSADVFGATFDAEARLLHLFDLGGKGTETALGATPMPDGSWTIAGASTSAGVGGEDLGTFSIFIANTTDSGQTFSKSRFATGSTFNNWATGIVSTPGGLLLIGNGIPAGSSTAGCNNTVCSPAFYGLVDPSTLALSNPTVAMPPNSRGGYDFEGLTGDPFGGDYYGAFFTGAAWATLTQATPAGLFGALEVTGCGATCPALTSFMTLGNVGTSISDAAADADGNAYVGGFLLPTSGFSGVTIKGASDAFVAEIGGTGLPPPCECSTIKTGVTGAVDFNSKKKAGTFAFTVDWSMQCSGGGGRSCDGAIDATPPVGSDIKLSQPPQEITCEGACSTAGPFTVTGRFKVSGSSAGSLAPTRRAGKSFQFRLKTFCVVGHAKHAEPDGVFTVVYDAKGRLDRRRSDLNGDGRPDGAS